MDACVGSASTSAALDRWHTYRLHGYRYTRQHGISAEACNSAVIKHLNRFLGCNYVTQYERICELYVAYIHTCIKGNEET